MAPRISAMVAIFVLFVLALYSWVTSSSARPVPASTAEAAQAGQLQAQSPFQALYAPAHSPLMNQAYQSQDPTETPTANPDNPLVTFTPDPNAPQIFITSQNGRFFANDQDVCMFNVTTATPPAFTEPIAFPVISFNPQVETGIPQGCNTPIPDPNSRPLTDLWHQPVVNPCATQPAQDHLNATPTLQAGVSPLTNFHGLFTGQLYVPAAGDITFNQYVDDAWVLGIGPKVGGSGEQPYYVSGTFDPPTPPAPTPSPITAFNGYLVVSRFQSGSGYTDLKQTTVHFPSAGYYPIELDYTECQVGELEMVLGSSAANPIPNGATPTVTPVPTVLCVSSSDWCTSISANGIGHNELRGVAVISQDHIWAVGGYDIDMTTQSGHSLVEFWNNSTWSVVSSPDVGILNGIVAVGNSNGDIYAVGDTGILHYNGSTWSQVSGRPGGNGIGGGPSNVWVVGNPSQGIQLYDGSWHDYTDPDGATLNAVAAIASDNVTAVGYTGSYPNRRLHIAQWNGSSWTTISGSIDADSYYTGVDFYDEKHLWAVGSYYYPGDDRYETLTVYGGGLQSSRTWSAITSPNPSTLDNRLNHVWFDTEGDVWAAGSYEKEDASGNNSLVMRWNDTGWVQVDSPAPGVSSELLGIATIPGNTAVITSTWAVGSYKAYSFGPSQTLVESIQAPAAPHTNLS